MADQRTLDQHHKTGLVRTDLFCHECNKNFIAELDYDVDGQHVIECPHCGHEHCRHIKAGFVSNDRWDGRNSHDVIKVPTRRVWKHNSLKATTTSTSEFIRNRWLNFGRD